MIYDLQDEHGGDMEIFDDFEFPCILDALRRARRTLNRGVQGHGRDNPGPLPRPRGRPWGCRGLFSGDEVIHMEARSPFVAPPPFLAFIIYLRRHDLDIACRKAIE